ncbi:MAG TPA: type II secretion system protein [Patescibacteria group bacterium]|nr:type II secretion system protein [Patescibacteria group bacterium]
MLSTIRKPKEQGFTIIEVLIVLAIAGLILLIVFLAVPALQRNARNTERKNDAAGALSSISEYLDNNGGSLPASAAFAAPNWTVGAAGTAQSIAKLGYYTAITLRTAYVAPGAAADTITIMEGTKCTNATTAAAGSTRQVAAVYGVEASGGYVWQCQES